MDGVIYAKTAAGLQEMRQHALALGAGARRLLILVDGRRPLRELRGLLGAGGDAAAAVAQLMHHQLIVQAGIEETSARSGGLFGRLLARGERETPAATDPALRDRVRAASLRLHDALGPEADSIVMRLEKCTDADALDAALQRAADVVREVRGRGAADAFRDALGLPPPV